MPATMSSVCFNAVLVHPPCLQLNSLSHSTWLSGVSRRETALGNSRTFSGLERRMTRSGVSQERGGWNTLKHGQKQISLCGNMQTPRVHLQQLMADAPLTQEPMPGCGRKSPRLFAPWVWMKKWDKNKDIYYKAVASGLQRRHGAPQVKEKEEVGGAHRPPRMTWHFPTVGSQPPLQSYSIHLANISWEASILQTPYTYKTEQNPISNIKKERQTRSDSKTITNIYRS